MSIIPDDATFTKEPIKHITFGGRSFIAETYVWRDTDGRIVATALLDPELEVVMIG